MARDSSGNHTLPATNPVVSGATITSTWANGTMSDLSVEVTDSLSRSGKGGMLAALKSFDGTIAAPGVAFSSETGTGLYRAGAADARFAIGGADIQKWTAAGVFAAALQAISAATITIKGAVADGAAAVGVVLDNTIALTAATAKALSVRVAGVEVAAVDKDGSFFGAMLKAISAAPMTIKGATADGATAVGVILDNSVALSNATAKAVSIRVNAVEKSYIDKDGSYVGPNVVRAWGFLSLGAAGAVTVNKGFNVTSASWALDVLTITLTNAMPDTNAAVLATHGAAMATATYIFSFASGTTTILVKKRDSTPAAVNFANGDVVHFAAFD